MARGRSNRRNRPLGGSVPVSSSAGTSAKGQSRKQNRPQAQIDPIGMGRKTLRTRSVLDNIIERSGPLSDEPLRRQSRMDAVADVRKKRLESIGRLNDAHAAAKEAIRNTPARPNQGRLSDFGSLSRNKAKKHVKEPDERRSPEKQVRDGPTCKERPKNNRGNGGSRSFVPWCGRRG